MEIPHYLIIRLSYQTARSIVFIKFIVYQLLLTLYLERCRHDKTVFLRHAKQTRFEFFQPLLPEWVPPYKPGRVKRHPMQLGISMGLIRHFTHPLGNGAGEVVGNAALLPTLLGWLNMATIIAVSARLSVKLPQFVLDIFLFDLGRKFHTVHLLLKIKVEQRLHWHKF